ncbi:fasciclin domain-containing protein [Adhaeribacter aquaticus]|uniref:fasciclin domain-containing protein n=1 Tax=Adhaeribacter aquaticus TaxID=299567 RepID=UPI000A071F99|nr:fasciclin domain-containing protein [Adhaeribacter aquaticus]
MKKIIYKPMAALAVAALTMFSCSSSNNMAASTGTDMQSSVRSGGMTDTGTSSYNATGVSSNAGTYSTTASVAGSSELLDMIYTNTEDKVLNKDLFDDIAKTKKYDALSLLRKSPNHTTFVTLLEKADLVNAIDQQERVTIFAPTNAAFARVPREKMMAMLEPEGKAALASMLQAHVVSGRIFTNQFGRSNLVSLSNDPSRYLPVGTTPAGTTNIGGAIILNANVKASDGVVHIVDNIINPVPARTNP